MNADKNPATVRLPAEIEDYLRRLRWALAPLPVQDQEEIEKEIRSHILDRFGSGGAIPVERVEQELGRAEELARGFLENYEISSALAAGSAWRLLLVAASLMSRSVGVFFSFLLYLVCYSVALTLAILALLKPILPGYVGFWTSADGSVYGLGLVDPGPGLVEHLGYWLVPLALAAAMLVYVGTTALLRRHLTWWRKAAAKKPGPLQR